MPMISVSNRRSRFQRRPHPQDAGFAASVELKRQAPFKPRMDVQMNQE
jgi:hypothetical protein